MDNYEEINKQLNKLRKVELLKYDESGLRTATETIQRNKKSSAIMAQAIIKEIPSLVKDGGLFYFYSQGQYHELTEEILIDRIYIFMDYYKILDTFCTSNKRDIILAIRHNPMVKRVTMNGNSELINFKNCILNVDTNEILEHSEDYYFSYKVDVDYNKDIIDCPYFNSFLAKIFPGDPGQPDLDTVRVIAKIGGYILNSGNELEQMFMFLGEGANGKSMLIKVFQMFFPSKLTTVLSLSELADVNGWTREKLVGSRLNISTEEKAVKVNSEQIKKIISGEMITACRKFQSNIEFIPRSTIILAANNAPYFNDTTDGIYRRMFILEFKSKFVSDTKYHKIYEPESQNIYRKIHEKELLKNIKIEAPAILNLFLKGLQKMKDDNWELIGSEATIKAQNEYELGTDSVRLFLDSNYEVIPLKERNSTNWLVVSDILNDYRRWYNENVSEGFVRYSVTALSKKIKAYYRVSPARKYTGVERLSCFPLKRLSKIDF